MPRRALDIEKIAWPASRLGELVEALARRSGLLAHPARLPQPADSLLQADDETVGRWVDAAAGQLGLEAEAVDALYSDVERMIGTLGPAILRLPGELGEGQGRLVALLGKGRKKVAILTPELRKRRLRVADLQAVLCAPYESVVGPQVDALLDEAGAPVERRPIARTAILREQLGGLRVAGGWLLRLPPGAPLARQLRQAGAVRPALLMFSLFFAQQILAIASWYVVGRGVFQSHFDWGWLLAWGILVLATIPLAMAVSDAQSELSMRAGAVFKQRLIHGALKLEPEEIRHQGLGQFLGRVMESEAVEMLALGGGFAALLSFISLTLAAVILSRGAGGMASAALLGFWVLVTLYFLWRFFQESRAWARAYRTMTNDLVERMVGHRTRLAQEDRRHWHDEEDLALDSYLKLSESVDGSSARIQAFVRRGWMFVGILSMAYPFISGSASPQALAVGFGGVLFASQALSQLVGGANSLISLLIAWEQVGPLFQAAERPRETQPLDFITMRSPGGEERSSISFNAGQPLLLARDVSFRYRPQGRQVIQEVSLQINQGERVLLEGPSGGGKSTLASLLTGLRRPESGSLLLWGYDRQILGNEAWRRRVVMAPQFQENHVFAETFAFNLLMGRRWPPTPEDLELAEQVCRELGLGEVLDRMPSGFQQMLGESGWQLSHGERSRLYIARTLLQQADLVILDESFGALDPENLSRSLQTVLKRAPTLLVIAHP